MGVANCWIILVMRRPEIMRRPSEAFVNDLKSLLHDYDEPIISEVTDIGIKTIFINF